jgi:hypothetical protein
MTRPLFEVLDLSQNLELPVVWLRCPEQYEDNSVTI